MIGVWTSASRQRVRLWDPDRGEDVCSRPVPPGVAAGQPACQRGPDPAGQQGLVEHAAPVGRQAVRGARTRTPSWPGCCPRSTRACSRNLAALVAAGTARADLEAILLTGIPSGIVPGFQNYTGPVLADMLRLNTAIPPSAKPNQLGLIGGDPAGFPNGRRVFDDVVTVELRAIAGVTVPLVDPSFTPDAAAGAGHRRADRQQRPGRLSHPVPVPRRAVQRLRHTVVIRKDGGQTMGEPVHGPSTRAASSSTSAAPSAPSSWKRPPRCPAGRSRSAWSPRQSAPPRQRRRRPHPLARQGAQDRRRHQLRGGLPWPARRAVPDLAAHGHACRRGHHRRRHGDPLPLAGLSGPARGAGSVRRGESAPRWAWSSGCWCRQPARRSRPLCRRPPRPEASTGAVLPPLGGGSRPAGLALRGPSSHSS